MTDPVDESRLLVVRSDGRLQRIAGGGTQAARDGLDALGARIRGIGRVYVDDDGTIYVPTYRGIWRIGDNGRLETFAARRTNTTGLFGHPIADANIQPHLVRMLREASGSFVVSTGTSQAGPRGVYRITSAFPSRRAAAVIASEDGSVAYVFDERGRHVATRDTNTGRVLLAFAYDDNGLLTTITDLDGLVTTIHRDPDGRMTAIEGPYGQVTSVTYDTHGYLASVTDAAGTRRTMAYGATGLLSEFRRAEGHTSRYTYDEYGLVETATDAVDATQTFDTVRDEGDRAVIRTSPLGRQRIYQTADGAGGLMRENTDPAGITVTADRASSRTTTVTWPDGTTRITTRGPNDRFGMQAPVVEKVTTTVPSALTIPSVCVTCVGDR